VLTARLRQAGDLIGITILDHIILGDDRTYSFADHSWPCS
jgi:DNA repair protein RadC